MNQDSEAPENKSVEIIVAEFRKDFETAVEREEGSFEHKGLLFVTAYAKYLLEYVEGKGEDSFGVTEASLRE